MKSVNLNYIVMAISAVLAMYCIFQGENMQANTWLITYIAWSPRN